MVTKILEKAGSDFLTELGKDIARTFVKAAVTEVVRANVDIWKQMKLKRKRRELDLVWQEEDDARKERKAAKKKREKERKEEEAAEAARRAEGGPAEELATKTPAPTPAPTDPAPGQEEVDGEEEDTDGSV